MKGKSPDRSGRARFRGDFMEKRAFYALRDPIPRARAILFVFRSVPALPRWGPAGLREFRTFPDALVARARRLPLANECHGRRVLHRRRGVRHAGVAVGDSCSRGRRTIFGAPVPISAPISASAAAVPAPLRMRASRAFSGPSSGRVRRMCGKRAFRGGMPSAPSGMLAFHAFRLASQRASDMAARPATLAWPAPHCR